jgi:hypothetical protein
MTDTASQMGRAVRRHRDVFVMEAIAETWAPKSAYVEVTPCAAGVSCRVSWEDTDGSASLPLIPYDEVIARFPDLFADR